MTYQATDWHFKYSKTPHSYDSMGKKKKIKTTRRELWTSTCLVYLRVPLPDACRHQAHLLQQLYTSIHSMVISSHRNLQQRDGFRFPEMWHACINPKAKAFLKILAEATKKVLFSTVKWVVYWLELKNLSVRKKPLLQKQH